MSEEKLFYKVDPAKVRTDDLMAVVSFVKVVKPVNHNHEMIVDDIDNGVKGIRIQGKEIIQNCYSADQYEFEEKVSKTRAAEILIQSHNRPLTVSFAKADGSERVLRGRLIKHEALLGRSMVEDLDAKAGERIRMVDHRTINYLCVDGVKYVVK